MRAVLTPAVRCRGGAPEFVASEMTGRVDVERPEPASLRSQSAVSNGRQIVALIDCMTGGKAMPLEVLEQIVAHLFADLAAPDARRGGAGDRRDREVRRDDGRGAGLNKDRGHLRNHVS